jgi:hypothetical protein
MKNRGIDRSGKTGGRDPHFSGFIRNSAESNRNNESLDDDGRRQKPVQMCRNKKGNVSMRIRILAIVFISVLLPCFAQAQVKSTTCDRLGIGLIRHDHAQTKVH